MLFFESPLILGYLPGVEVVLIHLLKLTNQYGIPNVVILITGVFRLPLGHELIIKALIESQVLLSKYPLSV